jgi:hypothetical protein
MNPERKQIIQEIKNLIHIDAKPKVPFQMKIFLALKYSDEQPDLINEIGLHWINDYIFCLNFEILAHMIGCTVDNIRKGLKDYCFKTHSDILKSFILPALKPK